MGPRIFGKNYFAYSLPTLFGDLVITKPFPYISLIDEETTKSKLY